MNATDVEPCATTGNEHVVRAARAEELFAALKVVDEHGACGWMEGDKTESAELGSPDCEHALLEIDIIELSTRYRGKQACGRLARAMVPGCTTSGIIPSPGLFRVTNR